MFNSSTCQLINDCFSSSTYTFNVTDSNDLFAYNNDKGGNFPNVVCSKSMLSIAPIYNSIGVVGITAYHEI